MKNLCLMSVILAPLILSANPALSRSGIPAAFHGHWAMAAADCTAGEPTAILLIDEAGLHQAEGEMLAAQVTVDAADPGHLIILARNSGGGGEWDSVEDFRLQEGGKSLAWQTLGAEAPPPGRLFRCD
jgi:hypothetical protein